MSLFALQLKDKIMAVGGLIGAGVAAASMGIGLITSAHENKKAERLQKQKDAFNQKWYDTKMSQDYTQRSDSQAVLKRQREMLQEQYKRAKASQVVAGGSDESLALQQQAANRSLSDTMTGIAENASAYKDKLDNSYMGMQNDSYNRMANMHAQRGASVMAAAGEAAGAGLELMGQDDSLFKKKA